MKNLALLTITLILTLTTSSFTNKAPLAEGEWLVDINEAYEVSKATNKPIFAFFTGSDWCGWCKRLQAVALNKQSFKDWAKKNVVLLELDFPRRVPQPENIKKQNRELAQIFQVRGYPTVWLFNAVKDKTTGQFKIDAIGQTGYPRGAQPGTEDQKFIQTLENLIAQKKVEKK